MKPCSFYLQIWGVQFITFIHSHNKTILDGINVAENNKGEKGEGECQGVGGTISQKTEKEGDA